NRDFDAPPDPPWDRPRRLPGPNRLFPRRPRRRGPPPPCRIGTPGRRRPPRPLHPRGAFPGGYGPERPALRNELDSEAGETPRSYAVEPIHGWHGQPRCPRAEGASG